MSCPNPAMPNPAMFNFWAAENEAKPPMLGWGSAPADFAAYASAAYADPSVFYQFPPNPHTAEVGLQHHMRYPPSDPFPTSSVPNGYGSYKYYPQDQVFSNWKMPVSGKQKPLTTVPYKTGPGTNNVRVRTSEKYRMVYSDYQRLELEKEFITNEFVTADRKADLSTSLNLTERQIKIWFQNRRAKKRRDSTKKI